jgi:cytochrome P450
MDPPDYLPYRQLLNPWFSPAASRRWEPMLRDIVTAFLNRIAPAGVGDLVLDVANPVPGVFTAMLLGLPVEDWRFYADPMHEIVFQPPGSPEHDRALVQYMGVLGKVAETIALRRTDPRDDLISLLATAEVGGAPLSDQTALEMASLVLIGGVDTTTGVLTNALLWLEEHPDVRARLAADPSLLPTATEEFLRYFTPTHALARTCTRDVKVGGVPLREGDRVLLSFAAANRDPEVFPDPDSVRFDREHYRHTTFGLGIHRCVGSTFARLEVQIVL